MGELPLQHKIVLTVGDWSNDGHNQSDDYNLMCNAPRPAIIDAYKKGTQLLGFSLVEDCCVNYEEMLIDKEKVKTLIEHGIVEYWNGKDGIEDPMRITHDEQFRIDELGSQEWARLYMKIVQLGEPWIEFEFIKAACIEIGGYGLFWS